MGEYWSGRRNEALKKSRTAASADLRDMYLRVAEHCQSLEEWCSGRFRVAPSAAELVASKNI